MNRGNRRQDARDHRYPAPGRSLRQSALLNPAPSLPGRFLRRHKYRAITAHWRGCDQSETPSTGNRPDASPAKAGRGWSAASVRPYGHAPQTAWRSATHACWQ